MNIIEAITVLVINYRTFDLIRKCVASLRHYYPQVALMLIDNGSADESTELIRTFAQQDVNTTCILNRRNCFHGPALDQGLHACHTDLVFTLDSDCTVIKGGFLESMADLFQQPDTYAAGELVCMDNYGYEVASNTPGCIRYVHPRRMLLDRFKYMELPRFTHHGAPGLHNMRQAARSGYGLRDFPVASYINHLGRGTSGLYGYHLGLRHKIENLIHLLRR